ncbi:MAG: hypothetical protein M1472_05490 [Planctomycetes bacterium]|nr:hypothetical protein [Planctomycetota bacterium]
MTMHCCCMHVAMAIQIRSHHRCSQSHLVSWVMLAVQYHKADRQRLAEFEKTGELLCSECFEKADRCSICGQHVPHGQLPSHLARRRHAAAQQLKVQAAITRGS